MEDSLEKVNDEEVSLPKATIDKIISESLQGKPATKELKDVVLQSAIEFIHLITSEANELCEREHKKTITHDHVYKSLENLGYTHYVKHCEEVYVEHVNLAKMKPSKTNKFKDSGMTMEELFEEQAKLIAIAKDAVEKTKAEEVFEKKIEESKVECNVQQGLKYEDVECNANEQGVACDTTDKTNERPVECTTVEQDVACNINDNATQTVDPREPECKDSSNKQ